MAFRLAVLLAVFIAVSAVPDKSLLKRPNHDHIDYYDCSGKANGNYLHPSDCTRYISCSNGNAADKACPDCDKSHVAGCAGYDYQIYDQTANDCLWPIDTTCQVDHHPGSSEETTDHPGSSEETTTTGTETPPPVNCQGLQDGDSCDKDDCEKCGYCLNKESFFFRCKRIFPSDPQQNVTGVIVLEACDDDLWWNPENKPDAVAEGGVCDKWENLSEAVQNAYLSDENCIPQLCQYGQDEADQCSGQYWYLDPAVSPDRQDLNCPSGLFYDPSTETCRNPENVDGC